MVIRVGFTSTPKKRKLDARVVTRFQRGTTTITLTVPKVRANLRAPVYLDPSAVGPCCETLEDPASPQPTTVDDGCGSHCCCATQPSLFQYSHVRIPPSAKSQYAGRLFEGMALLLPQGGRMG